MSGSIPMSGQASRRHARVVAGAVVAIVVVAGRLSVRVRERLWLSFDLQVTLSPDDREHLLPDGR